MSMNEIRPDHYTGLSIQPLDVIESWGLDKSFCLANVIKYIARHRNKGGLVDLEKAAFYLDYEIKRLRKVQEYEEDGN